MLRCLKAERPHCFRPRAEHAEFMSISKQRHARSRSILPHASREVPQAGNA
jgi:hypothetical protein